MLDAGILVRSEGMRDKKERSAAWVEKQVARMHRAAEQLAKDLGDKVFCHSERYSLADIALGCCTGWLDFRKPSDVDWSKQYAPLALHYKKMMERPAFSETVPQVPAPTK
jgi:glutathione S-transferase